MGIDTRKPPLPAATDLSTDNGNATASDLATDVSRRTDRTSYLLPEDGTPIVVPVKSSKDRAKGKGRATEGSQTSLLIEYFEGSQSGDKAGVRPSVRVKVTPRAKKSKSSDAVKITELGIARAPSYSRTVPLAAKGRSRALDGTEISHSGESTISDRGALVDLYSTKHSDLSTSSNRIVPMTSDISSLPTDSMLDAPAVIKAPEEEEASRGFGQEGLTEMKAMDTLRTPSQRQRSLSRERITQKVLEKLGQDTSASRKAPLSHSRGESREIAERDLKSGRRSSRKSFGDDDRTGSTESSLLSARGIGSNVSGASKSSINNPKLLQTVEDAIRRLILPEIETLKREQSIHYNREKFDRDRSNRNSASSESYISREDSGRRLSKATSEPRLKPKVVLNRDENDPGVTLSGDTIRHRKVRRSDRDATEKSSSRRTSAESASRDGRERRTGSKEHHYARDAAVAGLAGGILTAVALKEHDSHSRRHEAGERKKRRSKSRSRSNSIADTEGDEYIRKDIPPMPMRSELQGSDFTRESILSADTERPPSSDGRRIRTPVKEVSRSSPRAVPHSSSRESRTPVSSGKRSAGNLRDARSPAIAALYSPRSARSDRSLSSKAKDAGIVGAGLAGVAAAAAAAAHHSAAGEKKLDSTLSKTEGRAISPVQSAASYHEPDAAVTRDMPQMEGGGNADVIDRDIPTEGLGHSKQATVEDWYDEQHKVNDEYRNSIDYDSQRDSSNVDYNRMTQYTDESAEKRDSSNVDYKRMTQYTDESAEKRDSSNVDYNRMTQYTDESADKRDSSNVDYNRMTQYTDESAEKRDSSNFDYNRMTQYTDESAESHSVGQRIKDVGANPQYVSTPVGVESAVASLLEPSTLSSRSPENGDRGISDGSFLESPAKESVGDGNGPGSFLYGEGDNSSRERWTAIKQNARNLSGPASQERELQGSPLQSVAQSIESEQPELGESAIPIADDEMPAIGRGLDDPSTTASSQRASSIVEEQLGDPNENRDIWMQGNTPLQESKRGGYVGVMDHDTKTFAPRDLSFQPQAATQRNGPPVGKTGLALILGSEALAHESMSPGDPVVGSGYNTLERSRDIPQDAGRKQKQMPAYFKDEGYASGHPQSPIARKPLASYSQPPPLFDERELTPTQNLKDDPFVGRSKHERHLSGNSHGMASPLYDAATGQGINNIQSKDVVALMDHLTVRDGQRSARDTEILVTLVRSAAEMRNQFVEMKKMMGDRNYASSNPVDAGDGTSRGIPGGSRATASPRTTTRASREYDSPPAKKKNIFQRALRGIGSKNSDDLARIEDMLMQLLDEVEDLKTGQGLGQGLQRFTLQPSDSLDSYERLRAAPDSGYEPSGQAGTSSTPNHSGLLNSTPPSRQTPRMRSGFGGRKNSDHRISTVMEDDEDLEEHENYVLSHQFENSERLLTPTQEVRREVAPSYDTALRDLAQNPDVTPQTGERSSKHKSTHSSMFGYPKTSRWSKTTTSSAPEGRNSFQRRPYSEASQSGSEINVLPGENGEPYIPNDDDRIRSANSLANDEVAQSSSPVIPDESQIDDPKYQAHRRSIILEHPQPQHGPTRRHQSQLESQAYVYDTPGRKTLSPDSDTFGSVPALARGHFAPHRLSSGPTAMGGTTALSPISSEAGYSDGPVEVGQAQRAYAPPRPPKIHYDEASPSSSSSSAPARPPKIPAAAAAAAAAPFAQHAGSASPEQRDSYQERHAADDDDDDDDDGINDDYAHNDDDDDDDNNNYNYNFEHTSPWVEPVPVPRKKSPYSPGALLPPIEERYSMELERSVTPLLGARAAMGAMGAAGEVPAAGGVRKLTGPREMPGSGSGSGSGLGSAGGVANKYDMRRYSDEIETF